MDEIAPPTTKRRRALLWAGAAAAALVAALTAAVLLRSPEPTHHDVVAAPPPPAVVDLPTSQPSTTTPAPPPPPPVPHDYVAPAVPTRFSLTGRGFTISAHVCAMAPVFPLDPPGEQHHTVCWVTKGFGVMPGSRTATSYVLGHAWAQDPLEVLNKASSRATREVLRTDPRRLDGVPVFPAKNLLGSRIVLSTPRGTLTYEVRNAFGVDKYKLGSIDSIMNPRIRNRVVLITCAELRGVDYNYNIVLDARLASSRATSANRSTPAP